MKSIKAIISSLRVAMTDARQNESHFESWMILNEAICDAIDALAEQPAQPQQEPDDFDVWKARALQAEAVIAKFMEQPQQKPVAVVSGYYGGQCVILPIDPARIFNSNTALYTSPPAQRKPLTDEQIDAAVKAWFENEIVAGRQPFAKRMRAAIEAAHGIKENT